MLRDKFRISKEIRGYLSFYDKYVNHSDILQPLDLGADEIET